MFQAQFLNWSADVVIHFAAVHKPLNCFDYVLNYFLRIQSLQDDFTLINHYGAAFGHTRIQDSYLALRLEELKFAALLESLKSSDLQFQADILVEHRVLH